MTATSKLQNRNENNNGIISEDSEDDEDYVPVNDDNENETNDDALQSKDISKAHSILPPNKRKAVDDAFESLFGKCDDIEFVSTKNINNINRYNAKKPKSKKALKKNKKILADVFGGVNIASKLIRSAPSTANSFSVGRQSRKSLANQKKVIKEVKRFAGKDIEIERTIFTTSSEEKTNANNNNGHNNKLSSSKPDDSNVDESVKIANVQSKRTGIDSLLSQINGPQKISTIVKTNSDWENFKEKSGLEEELKKKAEGKDAYLVKKDFLQRVDLRQFEKEKAERDKKRASAAKL
mmetsp:Transcript_21700/g.30422  ORF Transcript_21700/g.30422 Transcript_21700/m.30422 type:complete len:294 (+) Transcript_21700:45-926(+)|eukprot:CAMPEP_0184857438 /NCGR_PEP_ID=MMETSP0580-20130426/2587_1 /TAXON_ID=1118495 /ORGANISM="Dactyliosolen fragilissimus" /LENGTH=293 /DNA_ID=CAMNT_0027353025 /DNA_START=17 /DNA_END=898 /DNA_ORIENTATION=+